MGRKLTGVSRANTSRSSWRRDPSRHRSWLLSHQPRTPQARLPSLRPVERPGVCSPHPPPLCHLTHWQSRRQREKWISRCSKALILPGGHREGSTPISTVRAATPPRDNVLQNQPGPPSDLTGPGPENGPAHRRQHRSTDLSLQPEPRASPPWVGGGTSCHPHHHP